MPAWLAVAAWLALSHPSPALAACGDAESDAAAVTSSLAAVAARCPCLGGSHRSFVDCAGEVAKKRVESGELPRACKAQVRRCATRSTCGRPAGSVTCCRPRENGRTRCKITTPERCEKAGGCPGHSATCCLACPEGACDAPTTTTTTSSSTSSLPTSTVTTTTTSATLAAVCGNGIIEGDEWCDGDSFCDGCTIRRYACCEYATAGGPCAVAVPAFTLFSNQYQVCGFLGGTYQLGMVVTGSETCADPPAGAPQLLQGGCGPAPTLPEPISVCCKLPQCVDTSTADLGAITVFVRNCLYANYHDFPVVVGTCVDGACVPAH